MPTEKPSPQPSSSKAKQPSPKSSAAPSGTAWRVRDESGADMSLPEWGKTLGQKIKAGIREEQIAELKAKAAAAMKREGLEEPETIGNSTLQQE